MLFPTIWSNVQIFILRHICLSLEFSSNCQVLAGVWSKMIGNNTDTLYILLSATLLFTSQPRELSLFLTAGISYAVIKSTSLVCMFYWSFCRSHHVTTTTLTLRCSVRQKDTSLRQSGFFFLESTRASLQGTFIYFRSSNHRLRPTLGPNRDGGVVEVWKKKQKFYKSAGF